MALTELSKESTVPSNLNGDLLHAFENPYALQLDSPAVDEILSKLLITDQPYIDKTTNPDISEADRELAVYKLPSNHEASSVCRAIEGSVIESDWGQSPSITVEEESTFEDNSTFFLVVDVTNPAEPKPAASLRIADCLRGPCESVQFYKASFGEDVELPADLTVTPTDIERGLWDVVGIMAPKHYRDGQISVWAYHALYRASIEEGVHRWISNIVEKELDNLHSLAIPFRQIEGTEKSSVPIPGRSEAVFGFYTIDVDDIPRSMNEKIGELLLIEDDAEFYSLIANLASIALNGSVVRPKISK